MNRRFASMLVAATVAISATACSFESNDGAATSADTAVVGITNEPRSLDPGIDLIRSSVAIARTILEPLLETDDEFGVVPGLATEWENTEPTKWQFTLREGVTFSNGEPFNADSAAASILATRDFDGGALTSYFAIIENATAIDEHTLEVETTRPTLDIPALMSLQFMYPKDYYAEVGPEAFGRAPIGTGPFLFSEWTPGVAINVTRNDDYWGDAPASSGLRFDLIADDGARVAALQTGRIDVALNVPPQLIAEVEATDGARIETTPGLRKFFIEFNPETAPTDNVEVRRAIAHAIDPEAIVENVLGGRGELDPNVFYSGFDSAGGHDGSYLEYDPDRSREILSEIGPVPPIDFYSTSGRYILDTEVAEAVAGMLEAVGLRVNRHPLEIGAYQELAEADNMPGINMRSTGVVYPAESATINTHFQPDSLYKNCNSPELSGMVAEADQILEPAAYAAAYNEIESYILFDFVCWVPLYVQIETTGVGPKVESLGFRFGEDVEFSTIVLREN